VDAAYCEVFYAEMRPKIARFIRARFPFDLAEDLANETMLTLWRKDARTPTTETELRQLRSFTYAIAIGHVRNAERKMVTEGKLSDELAAAAVTGGVLRIHGPDRDPTFEAVVPSSAGDAIRKLRADDQQAINLLVAGLTTAEIADILGITPKAASMRLSRAKDRLRSTMAGAKEVVGDA